MPSPNLPNKPLIEAIFEVRWEMQGVPGLMTEEHKRFLTAFQTRARNRFPVWEPVSPGTVALPELAFARFRVEPNAWPLLQIAPSLLTVNETAGYTWEGFRNSCRDAATWLFATLEECEVPPVLTKAMLRYINGDLLNGADFLHFVRDFHHVRVEYPTALHADGLVSQRSNAASIQLGFDALDQSSIAVLKLTDGYKAGDPAVIWELLMEHAAPKSLEGKEAVLDWLESAHTVLDAWFFQITEGALRENYDGSTGA